MVVSLVMAVVSSSEPQNAVDGALLDDAVVGESAMSQQLSTLEDKAQLVGWDAASDANRWCQWVEILELLMLMMQNTTTHDTARPSRTLICLESSGVPPRLYRLVRPRA